MKQIVKDILLPMFSIEMDISECRFDTLNEIVAFIEEQIQAHKAAKYIATFNHLQHTRELPEGRVADEIIAAYNIVFCLAFSLQEPEQLATRPQSIGICQTDSSITLSFVEAPMPVVNGLMEQWANSLLKDDFSTNQSFEETPQQECTL